MGLQNWFSRVLMSTWFREITVIDAENLPNDRGAVIVSWHPGGLFDKMLTRGLLPDNQYAFDGILDSEEELNKISKKVAEGSNIIVFPEGDSHSSPKAKKIQDNAARIAIRAKELAEGKPPVIVPVGIHYSKKHYFRERVALTVERPLEISGNVEQLSDVISGEISRASLSRDDWKDRELIWKARSIIHAERMRQSPEIKDLENYGQTVIGARRVRAAWEWFAENEPEKCQELENRTRAHFERIDFLDLKPHHVDTRPQSVTLYGFMKSIFFWLFAWSFMLGFVTFSALAGSLPPFLFVVGVDRTFGPKFDDSKRGSLKLYTALAAYPVWWLIAAYAFTWTLLSDSSPIAWLADYSLIIEFLFSLPAPLVFPLMAWWMPASAKLQIKLYVKGKSSWRRMRLWAKWRNQSFNWVELCKSQQKLASDLVNIGDGLVLPGDNDWVEPSAGLDDISAVNLRH